MTIPTLTDITSSLHLNLFLDFCPIIIKGLNLENYYSKSYKRKIRKLTLVSDFFNTTPANLFIFVGFEWSIDERESEKQIIVVNDAMLRADSCSKYCCQKKNKLLPSHLHLISPIHGSEPKHKTLPDSGL